MTRRLPAENMARGPPLGKGLRRMIGALLPALTALLLFSAPLGQVSAGPEHDYVAVLQASLVEAANQLQKAGLALQQCLANDASCTADPEPFLFDILQARIEIEIIQLRLGDLDVPEKYMQVHLLAIEGLTDISVALNLLSEGIRDLEPAPIELATAYMDSAREKIESVYQQLAELPPQEEIGLAPLLWPLVAGMAVLVAFNTIFTLRSLSRTQFRRKAEASICPRCGQEMKDWRSYPVRVVKSWMNRHLKAYHSEEG